MILGSLVGRSGPFGGQNWLESVPLDYTRVDGGRSDLLVVVHEDGA